MNLTRPTLISKTENSISARAKDISYSGIGCYTDRILYSGMKMNIRINNTVHTGQVVHVLQLESDSSPSYQIGMMFCDPFGKTKDIREYVDQLSENTKQENSKNINDQRRHVRKLFDQPIEIILKETCANISQNDFQISRNGFTCCVDQYVPLFREIEIKIKTPALEENSIAGVVVKCDKIEDYYDLAVFCPQCNLDKLASLSNN